MQIVSTINYEGGETMEKPIERFFILKLIKNRIFNRTACKGSVMEGIVLEF